jgi:hypothetical protein
MYIIEQQRGLFYGEENRQSTLTCESRFWRCMSVGNVIFDYVNNVIYTSCCVQLALPRYSTAYVNGRRRQEGTQLAVSALAAPWQCPR